MALSYSSQSYTKYIQLKTACLLEENRMYYQVYHSAQQNLFATILQPIQHSSQDIATTDRQYIYVKAKFLWTFKRMITLKTEMFAITILFIILLYVV